PNHKPAMIVALSPFDGLCGFRRPAEAADLIEALGVDTLRPYADILRAHPEDKALREVLAAVLTAEPEAMAATVTAAAAAAARLAGTDSPYAADYAAYAKAADSFPGDRGVIAAMLLNHVRLQPGEALYLGAGVPHAYLGGLGVEIMANSDNVLRCGLTPKHIDVPELLKITDFTPLVDPRWPDEGSDFGHDFEVPVADFALHSADLDAYRKPGQVAGRCGARTSGRPYLVLCASGEVAVDVAGTVVELRPGRAAFVAARDAAFTLTGTGETFLATVGDLGSAGR
ncbi:MAG TPA: mannose-6-phosphate isomerase, class I, partial [Jatrophihabitantaceae bacterium]